MCCQCILAGGRPRCSHCTRANKSGPWPPKVNAAALLKISPTAYWLFKQQLAPRVVPKYATASIHTPSNCSSVRNKQTLTDLLWQKKDQTQTLMCHNPEVQDSAWTHSGCFLTELLSWQFSWIYTGAVCENANVHQPPVTFSGECHSEPMWEFSRKISTKFTACWWL